MVKDKEAYATIQRNEWEQPREVVMYDATIFICKHTKSKYICNHVIDIIIEDHFGSLWIDRWGHPFTPQVVGCNGQRGGYELDRSFVNALGRGRNC